MMSEHPDPARDDAPRLGPRPLDRPDVDSDAAAVFGRPPGVLGAFASSGADSADSAASPDEAAKPTPPPPLAEAFSRPDGEHEVALQRPPGAPSGNGDAAAEPALWTDLSDPWRNPGAPAMLGAPAVLPERDDEDAGPPAPGAALSLSEAVLGGRLTRTATVIAVVLLLAIGATGGLVGWLIGRGGEELNRSVTLTQTGDAKEHEPGSVAAMAQAVSPAVVSIQVLSGQAGGVGSGVMIDGDGYVITNDHVVAPAADDDKARITVVFTDGTKAAARLVGRDPKSDLAVIKVEVTNPTVIELGRSADLAPGDRVIAVGSPFGLDNTVTEGIVSALHRPVTASGIDEGERVTYDAIQTDAAINPGNSGGALVDAQGRLVGINSLIRTVGNDRGEGGSIGLGFAIPIDYAVRISEELIENGEVVHAALGVEAASVSANASEGARVQDVTPDGPADRAAIKEGDVIIKVGDRAIRTASELIVVVRTHRPGDRVGVRFVRGGRELVADVKLGVDR